MPICPTCSSPITVEQFAQGVCPQCANADENKRTLVLAAERLSPAEAAALPEFAPGAGDVRATLASLLNVGDAASPSLGANPPIDRPTGSGGRSELTGEDLLASIHFGPSAGKWPVEDALPGSPAQASRVGCGTEAGFTRFQAILRFKAVHMATSGRFRHSNRISSRYLPKQLRRFGANPIRRRLARVPQSAVRICSRDRRVTRA